MSFNLSDRQPKQLWALFGTEMWERYGFYTMRAIMILYLVQVLVFKKDHAYALYGAFSGLLYLTPVVGGWIADTLLGFRRSIYLGGWLLALGYVILACPGTHWLYLGLSIIIIGNGFFKTNCSGILGSFYGDNDPRREGGFAIFYAGINLGAVLPPLIVASIISHWGWHSAFLMAAAGVLLGMMVFYFGLKKYPALGQAPQKGRLRYGYYILLAVGLIVVTIGLNMLIRNEWAATLFLFTVGSIFILFTLIKAVRLGGHVSRRLFLCLGLILFSILFWTLYQQAALSLTIFTQYNVQRHIGSWVVPTEMFQALNPIIILIFGPILAKLWVKMAHKNTNPSIPAKFAWGTILMGAGFVILTWGIGLHGHDGLIGASWVIASYFLQTMGELWLSPVGLSMATELPPKNMVGLMVGVWIFASAFANELAGFVSQLTALPSNTNNPMITDPAFSHVFNLLGWSAVAAGGVVLMLSPYLKRFALANNTA